MTTLRSRGTRPPPRLRLLGGFTLTVAGGAVTLPAHARRVLAYLSIVSPGRPGQPRTGLAERLWSDAPADRSAASLRTALWRIRQADAGIVQASRESIWLDEAVEVDVWRSAAQASRLLGDAAGELDPRDADPRTLRDDLLPGWEEDWLLLERERIRHVHIHALEALAHRLRRLGRQVEAIDAAYAAIAGEPLRESAHAALIEVFLAEGNIALARRQLGRYADLVWTELGMRPSVTLVQRVAAAEDMRAAPGPSLQSRDPSASSS